MGKKAEVAEAIPVPHDGVIHSSPSASHSGDKENGGWSARSFSSLDTSVDESCERIILANAATVACIRLLRHRTEISYKHSKPISQYIAVAVEG
jgi:hypothetical protein